ncbi:MAG: carotenoid oxygenase family protein [Woeseiaceae bacterium]|nr:carotenoid oxygenase family protein [Woeseiaceae bacterium]
MATLTRNLFHGSSERHFELEVAGDWPDDVDGWLFNVGPERTAPGGHWFTGQGMLCRVGCRPDDRGRIAVDLRRVETPISKLRDAQPDLFRRSGVQEVSPFGFTNFANTNVQSIGGRLFLGYDVGRPVEVDPETLEVVTPVGANAEWLVTLPAPVEPMIAVAAHPGPDWDENALFFANYQNIPIAPDRHIRLCRWDLEGEIEHWRIDDVPHFDSIHDVKVTRSFVVVSDLPFVVEPFGPDPTRPRRAVADVTNIWIVRKADLRATPPGAAVPHRHLTVPMMGGHMAVEFADDGRELTLFLTHHPMTDLGAGIEPGERGRFTGEAIDADYEGLPEIGNQPSGIGRYRIDVDAAKVVSAKVAVDPERFWGGALFTQNHHLAASRERPGNLWVSGVGHDPGLVTERWWRTYAEVHENVFVAPRDFPGVAVPGALARFELDEPRLAELYAYDGGAFPHPPTFVPRIDCRHDTDGYVLVFVHRDGDKAIDVFEAGEIERGPIASASAPGFALPLLLHSWWCPKRVGPRPSSYRVDPVQDAWDTLQAFGTDPSAGLGIGRSIFDRIR